jgi:hypothetical protein
MQKLPTISSPHAQVGSRWSFGSGARGVAGERVMERRPRSDSICFREFTICRRLSPPASSPHLVLFPNANNSTLAELSVDSSYLSFVSFLRRWIWKWLARGLQAPKYLSFGPVWTKQSCRHFSCNLDAGELRQTPSRGCRREGSMIDCRARGGFLFLHCDLINRDSLQIGWGDLIIEGRARNIYSRSVILIRIGLCLTSTALLDYVLAGWLFFFLLDWRITLQENLPVASHVICMNNRGKNRRTNKKPYFFLLLGIDYIQ